MKKILAEILKSRMKFGALPAVMYRGDEEKALIDAVFSTAYFQETDSAPQPSRSAETAQNMQPRKDTGRPPKQDDDSKTLRDLISTCTVCGDMNEKKYPSGSLNFGLMVILNSPMMMSTLEKNLYRDDSIVMMKNIIEKGIGISLKDIYITNIIKCEPDSIINKPSMMFRNCERIIKREIRELKPKIILVMGDMLPLRPILRASENIQWYNIDHPVTILKHPDRKRKAWNTILELKNYMDETD